MNCSARRRKLKPTFWVRTCVDRLAGDGTRTISAEMGAVEVKGLHRVEVRDNKGDVSEALLEIRYSRVRVLPPQLANSIDIQNWSWRWSTHRKMELQKGTRSDQLEADHRSAYKRQRRGHRKLALVCIALEDRNLSQNPEIRMQSGRIEAANRRSTGEFNRRFLHPQLANFLDDHAEPIQLGNHSTLIGDN
jgi:hypothetical protein